MKKIVVWIVLYGVIFAGSYESLLFHGNCITCHEIATNKSAPSIQTIKKSYMKAFPSKEAFVNYMSIWVYDPKIETSLMHDEIEKFGLMPHLAYDKEVLKQIATFIYEKNFDE